MGLGRSCHGGWSLCDLLLLLFLLSEPSSWCWLLPKQGPGPQAPFSGTVLAFPYSSFLAILLNKQFASKWLNLVLKHQRSVSYPHILYIGILLICQITKLRQRDACMVTCLASCTPVSKPPVSCVPSVSLLCGILSLPSNVAWKPKLLCNVFYDNKCYFFVIHQPSDEHSEINHGMTQDQGRGEACFTECFLYLLKEILAFFWEKKSAWSSNKTCGTSVPYEIQMILLILSRQAKQTTSTITSLLLSQAMDLLYLKKKKDTHQKTCNPLFLCCSLKLSGHIPASVFKIGLPRWGLSLDFGLALLLCHATEVSSITQLYYHSPEKPHITYRVRVMLTGVAEYGEALDINAK